MEARGLAFGPEPLESPGVSPGFSSCDQHIGEGSVIPTQLLSCTPQGSFTLCCHLPSQELLIHPQTLTPPFAEGLGVHQGHGISPFLQQVLRGAFLQPEW